MLQDTGVIDDNLSMEQLTNVLPDNAYSVWRVLTPWKGY